MSCHFSISKPRRVTDLLGGPDVAELYRDLVRLERREDFRWLALSQGVPAERIDELWRFVRTTRA